jgi:hypothetical protein
MKQFIIFIIIFAVLAAGFAVFSHFYLDLNPKKIVIALDASYNMNDSWQKALETVKNFEKMKYTSFALITDKVVIHSWDRELKPYKLGNIKPYGPTDLSVFMDANKFQELKKAAGIYLITNSQDVSLFLKDSRYKIIQLK